MLLQPAGERDVDRELTRKCRSEIWEGYGAGGQRPDQLTEMVARAVADIEAMCRPHLKA
jgi:hypothetical protein